jgi:hypothetical protein
MDYQLPLGIKVTSDFQLHSAEFPPLEAQTHQPLCSMQSLPTASLLVTGGHEHLLLMDLCVHCNYWD